MTEEWRRKPQWHGPERCQTDYLYQKEIQVGEKFNPSSTTASATIESHPEEEEVTECDSSSDEETCESDKFVEEDSAGCS